MTTTNLPADLDLDNEPTRRIEPGSAALPGSAGSAGNASNAPPRDRQTVTVPFSRVRLAQNVRKTIDQKSIDELAASIDKVGLIQPPTGRALPSAGDFELVIGQRRYLALQALHAKDPVRFPGLELFVTTAPDSALPLLQLAENLGRENMAPYDIVVELAKLASDGSMSAPEIAEQIGCSASAVKTFLRIGRAPEYVRTLLLRVEITARKLDADRNVVVDRHGRAELKTESLPGLDVKKVAALTKLAETLVGNDKRCARMPGYRPMAEKTVLRIARRCVVEQWTVDTLESRCEQAIRAPAGSADNDDTEAAPTTEPQADPNALVIKKSKLTIDLARAQGLRGPARDEFVANLRAALKQLNVFLQDLRGH